MLLRLLVVMVADLSKIDLICPMPIAHSILQSIIATITDWLEMVHPSIPWAFNRDGDAEIELASRIVDF